MTATMPHMVLVNRSGFLVKLYAEARVPPREALLFKFGVNSTLKGDFTLTQASAAAVMEKFANHGVDLNFDYEHGSHDPQATPEQKKGAGWCQLQLRKDGIWLVDIKWSDQAATYLRNAEYRYLSPAFKINPKTGEIVEVVNCALTNLPATNNQQPLVAANRKGFPVKIGSKIKAHMETKNMSVAELGKKCGIGASRMQELSEDGDATDEEMSRCDKVMKLSVDDYAMEGASNGLPTPDNEQQSLEDAMEDMMTVKTAPAARNVDVTVPHSADEANEDNNRSTSRGISADVLASLTGEKDPKAVIRKLLSMRDKAESYDADHETLVQLQRDSENRERRELFAQLRREGKSTPDGDAFARTLSTAMLRNYVKATPKVGGASGIREPSAAAVNVAGIELNRAEVEINELMFSDPKEYAEHKRLLSGSENEGKPSPELSRILLSSFLGKTPAPGAELERTGKNAKPENVPA